MRLIDADALIKDIDNYYHNPIFPHPGTTWLRGLELAVALLLKAPTIDPESLRKKGEWEKWPADTFALEHGCIKLRCLACYHFYYHSAGDSKHFCPNCGADMRGKDDD